MPIDDGFVVALPYGLSADWVKNVLASGSATIAHDGSSYDVDRPEVVPLSAVGQQFSPADQRAHRLFGVDQCLRVRRAARTNPTPTRRGSRPRRRHARRTKTRVCGAVQPMRRSMIVEAPRVKAWPARSRSLSQSSSADNAAFAASTSARSSTVEIHPTAPYSPTTGVTNIGWMPVMRVAVSAISITEPHGFAEAPVGADGLRHLHVSLGRPRRGTVHDLGEHVRGRTVEEPVVVLDPLGEAFVGEQRVVDRDGVSEMLDTGTPRYGGTIRREDRRPHEDRRPEDLAGSRSSFDRGGDRGTTLGLIDAATSPDDVHVDSLQRCPSGQRVSLSRHEADRSITDC